MESSAHFSVAFWVVSCTLVGLWFLRSRITNAHPLPPSPRRWPLIGNMLAMPTENEHIGFMQLGKQLNSEIIWLSVFGISIVVLNSIEDAVNLLEKRSSIYSHRISPTMMSDPSLMYWPDFTLFQGYTDRWRKARRMMHAWLNKKAAESFESSQQLQARMLLQRLLTMSNQPKTSDQIEKELYRMSAATMVDSIYGYSLESSDDPFVLDIQEATDNGSKAALQSNFLVNIFPSLTHVPSWLPGAGWKKIAREWREQKDRAVKNAYNWTKSQIDSGTNKTSMVSLWLEHKEELGLIPEEIEDFVSDVAVTVQIGGADTTTKSLLVFVMAMILSPDVQKKAQEEIDSVVGLDRLPTMEDRAKLVYLERLLQEVLRWRPLLPNGFPHATFEDDIYKGYRIPAGTLVIANIWAISRNEDVYPDPETFNPDRFLDTEVPLAPAFGFGRRICPGIHFANASLFITMASILATFNIRPSKNEDGQPVFPEATKSASRINFHPKTFGLELVPRSQACEDLIHSGV